MTTKLPTSIVILLFLMVGLKPNVNAEVSNDFCHSTLSQFSFFNPLDSGKLVKFFKPHSFGERKWGQDRQYVGDLRFGRPHGKGTYHYEDGGVYKGAFFKGYREGYGEYLFPDGNRYEGDWEDGEMEGSGSMIFSCGHEYIGEFSDNQINGEGTIVLSNGEVYSGNWKDGETEGYGVFTRQDGSQYIGNSLQGKRHGQGKIMCVQGDSIKGNWDNGILDGSVTMFFDNGDTFHTYWKDGEWQEKGTYLQEDQKVFDGDLADILEDLGSLDDDDIAQNLGTVYYTQALEYTANNKFDNAIQLMYMADQYTPMPSEHKSLIAMQLELIESKKSGWAQLNED